jgi:hypothetical protein
VLGLIHEHKRPDRESFAPFHCKNVLNYPWSDPDPDNNCCGPTGTCCDFYSCQFLLDHTTFWNQEGPGAPGAAYDLNSIMHYRRNAFTGNGLDTLGGGPLSNPSALSPGDIARVQELYGCLAPPKPKCPAACDPLFNTCSQPTAQTCIFPSVKFANPRGACACRAGYKADSVADGDTTKQWRLPADEGNFRVWVAQGVSCNTLCNVSTGSAPCGEVTELPADCLHM